MVKEKLLQMIDTFRKEFNKESTEVQKHEQLIDSLKEPCQIYFLTSADTKLYLLVITRFQEIRDKTIEVITLSSTNYIDQLEQFEKMPQWSEKISNDPMGRYFPMLIHQSLLGFGRDIKEKRGLFYNTSLIGSKMRLRDDVTIWRFYGNLDEFDFNNEATKIVHNYKMMAEQAKTVQDKTTPAQITESIPDSINGLGTFFYPPILVGEVKPTLREEIENRTYELLSQKAIMGEFEGVNFVISKGGLFGLETNNPEKAESIFNIVMGSALMMGLPLHALKSNEIANITINKQTFSVTGSSWSESTYRMMMFANFPPNRNMHLARTKITINDLNSIIEKAKSLVSKGEQLNKLKLLTGAFTHFDNHEFSQSFIMSWTVIEIHIHELWNKKMQSANVTRKIREDLDRWDFYRVLEVLHLDRLVSNDDYYELKYLNGLRNDIIHDGHEVTEKQALRCYDLAKIIVKTDLNVTQEINKGSQIYLGL